MLKTIFFIFAIITSFIESAERGYGDWLVEYPGYPDMKDRRILLLTNSCRMDPTGYRDKYLGNHNILLPQNYPAVDPLYWQIDLNRVARVHSEDQAENGMSHNSSDGTSFSDRVKSYYTKSGWIAENIAAGNNNAESTIGQWLMDLVDYQNQIPADDNSGDDGHRKNIMSSNYKEMGAGYAYGPAKYNYFWTQDFGGGDPSYDNPISSTAHFIDDNETLFMATYKDPMGAAPQNAILKLNDQNYNMSVFLGTSTAGTYQVVLASSDSCRNYYIEFTDSDGTVWKHPEGGELITTGEGNCSEQYVSPEELSSLKFSGNQNPRSTVKIIKKSSSIFQLNLNNNMQVVDLIEIYNISGQKVYEENVLMDKNSSILVDFKEYSKGFYFLNLLHLGQKIGVFGMIY